MPILCISMFPFWFNGYAFYILIALFPLLFRAESKVCLAVWAFSLTYSYPFMFRDDTVMSSFLFILLYPGIAMSAGLFLGRRLRNPQTGLLTLVLMFCCLALPVILANVIDFIETRSFINVSRTVAYNSTGDVRGATGYGMMAALAVGCCGLFLLQARNFFDSRLKVLLLVFSIGAVFSCVHLVNRTGLVLAVVSCLAALFVPPYSKKKIVYVVIMAIVALVVFFYFFGDAFEMADAVEAYNKRDHGNSEVSTLSGRTDRYIAAIKMIIEEPWGDIRGLVFEGRGTYAHLMVLDAGVISGVIPMVILLILEVYFALTLFKAFRKEYLSCFERGLVLLIMVTYVLQTMVEPIIQGSPQFFVIMFFASGLFSAMNRRFGGFKVKSESDVTLEEIRKPVRVASEEQTQSQVETQKISESRQEDSDRQ